MTTGSNEKIVKLMADKYEHKQDQQNLHAHTAKIVAAYVSNNMISSDDISKLIKSVFSTLKSLERDTPTLKQELKPAISIRKSVQDDYIVCLEDGKKLKMLKRHLRTCYGLTPEEYRTRWSLPSDYPMVAPNYAKHRQKLAKDIGLGRRGK